ncbi:stage II sporulation protein P [Serpentinicella alkaliphila]|uniref:Stage II sporulation protein P n=1 Tax=Serpentinicella alkaliphila TaxID=1734049 RepID=A0A4R2U2V9_9FIRM|nr:stage II sporulation protein P [Serpentinicella alkaliphila]QUH26921.1 stage II sporulation protein P [Serpentinicella alkaliphila]TCQ08155.1 stage II sporulation protein P [Serpentinicella alkaliphila]
MGKKPRNSFSDDHYNLIIAVLLIVIFFFLMKIVIQYNFKDFISNNNQSIFMKGTISHAFPASTINDNNNISTFGSVNKSLFKSIFRVDLSNPVTYAQAQFPASYLHQNNFSSQSAFNQRKLNDETSNNNPVIYFTNFDGTEIDITEGDEDDLGELRSGGVYLLEENNVVDSINNNEVDLGNIDKPRPITFEKGKPQILIYHTHGTESYYPASEGNYHSLRTQYTVIHVSEIITRELEKRGFEVIHDQTLHDYPSYNGSYSRSLETAKNILDKNPTVKVVLDIHRDGFDNVDATPNRQNLINNNTVSINGETATRFQFVIGPDSKNRSEVEKFAKLVKAVSDSKYPGFSKPILVKPLGRYNQFLSDYYGLIELGSNANTIEQAERTAKYLADVLATSLELLSQ